MADTRSVSAVLVVWNRRLHFYLGLYLLFFSWLFAFTGLLLNHPGWEVAQFWPKRVQSTAEAAVRPPASSTNLDRAREIAAQIGADGEIQLPATQPAPGDTLAFQISRPGRVVEVRADLRSGRATVRRHDVNVWGVMHVLHTFTGVPANDSVNERDWAVTTVWALSMDAVAAGLIVMVFSSYVMWWPLKQKRRWGVVALVLGFGTCGLFVAGLRWLM